MIELVKNIDEIIYDDFVSKHQGTIYQSSNWACVKNNWDSQRIAVYEDGQLIGTALILFKSIPMTPFKLAYMPRGPVCDYRNLDHFKQVLQACVDVAKEHRAFTLKFDPQISRDAGQEIKDYVTSIGGKHGGYDKGIVYSQPNFLMITELDEEEEVLFDRFDSKVRNLIRKGNQAGVHVHLGELEDVEDFAKLMEITAQRDDFGMRDASYFKRLLTVLGVEAQLYLIKLNVEENLQAKLEEQADIEKELQSLQDKLEPIKDEPVKKAKKLRNQLDQIQARMNKSQTIIADLQDCLEKGQSEVLLSGAILATFGDTAYYMYAASSNDFRDVMPNYRLLWRLMTDAIAEGCSYFDFGGVSGYTSENNQEDPLRGLYDFKKNFASEMFETIGEFDLVIMPTINKIFETAMGLRKSLRGRK